MVCSYRRIRCGWIFLIRKNFRVANFSLCAWRGGLRGRGYLLSDKAEQKILLMVWQLIIFIASEVLFNYINSEFDAYRFFKHKTVAHAVNFGIYAVIVGVQLYLSDFVWWFMIIFCAQAFLNRQVTFDIPLNLRRRKTNKAITWDYISKAKPPKAIMDRIEIRLFGYNGRAITMSYIILWIVSMVTLFILIKK